MKIEPRKNKKLLKYAAVGACVAISVTATGCDAILDDVKNIFPDLPGLTEENRLAGAVPMMTAPPEYFTTIGPDGAELAGMIMPETTFKPEIAGAIPTPEPEVALSGDIAFEENK